MRHFLLLGLTGVGKSSFINATFGVQLAETDPFEACTNVVKYFARNTPWGEVCLIDTPGMAEGEAERDEAYLYLIRKQTDWEQLEAILYLSPLKETRFRAEEKAALHRFVQRLGYDIWHKTWLILTFAASVPPCRCEKQAEYRIMHIQDYLRNTLRLNDGKQRFQGFRKIFLVDNIVTNWCDDGIPMASALSQ